MTLSEIRQSIKQKKLLRLKFVRLNGHYRFCDLTGFNVPTHKELSEGESVESAGFLRISHNSFVIEGYSDTLKMGFDENDPIDLTILLGVPCDNGI